jgi:hypothetical protein
MIGTDRCVYETPCHWCSKWDKQCDKKIGYHIDNDANTNLLKTCSNCVYYEWNMPHCKECNATNGFRYFTLKT